jgi:DNA-binding NtrC family response regulator
MRKRIDHKEVAGTILLVEENTSVRSKVASVCAGQGFAVVEAGSAASALELFGKHSDVIDALFTDAELLECGGTQLVTILLGLKPDLKIIISCATYSESIPFLLRHGQNIHYLSRPFNVQDIERVFDTVFGFGSLAFP